MQDTTFRICLCYSICICILSSSLMPITVFWCSNLLPLSCHSNQVCPTISNSAQNCSCDKHYLHLYKKFSFHGLPTMQWNLKTVFKPFHLIQTWCHINVYPKSDADLVTFTSYYAGQGVYVLNFSIITYKGLVVTPANNLTVFFWMVNTFCTLFKCCNT